MEEVTYCEFLAFGEPREVKTDLENAKRLYNSKLEALKNHPFIEALSFVGIKDENNNWIINNDNRGIEK